MSGPPEVPEDLRPSATRLWDHATSATAAVTETLTACLRILRELRGDPERLAAARDLLATEVAGRLAAARDDIDAGHPAVAASWEGTGAARFAEHLPRLCDTIASARDSAAAVAGAVDTFGDGMARLWRAVIDRTEAADDEVVAALSATASRPHAATAEVIDAVERYSRYAEDLAGAVLGLSGDAHAAGRRLASAAVAPLPGPAPGGDATTWNPSHPRVAVDIAALHRMSATLSGTGAHWEAAAAANDRAADQLAPESFGLAGAHFHGEVHTVLARDRHLYGDVDARLTGLAAHLRRIGEHHTGADADLAAEIRRLSGE